MVYCIFLLSFRGEPNNRTAARSLEETRTEKRRRRTGSIGNSWAETETNMHVGVGALTGTAWAGGKQRLQRIE